MLAQVSYIFQRAATSLQPSEQQQRRHHPKCAWLRMTFLLSLTIHAHACPGFIHFPAGGHVLPGLFEQFFGLFGVRLAQHGVASLIVKVVFQRHRGRHGIELHWVFALCSAAGVKTEQRPVPGLHRELLLGQAMIHVDAACDAMRVGNDDRRPVVVASDPLCRAPCSTPAAPASLCISTTRGTEPQMLGRPSDDHWSESSPMPEDGVMGYMAMTSLVLWAI